MARTKGLSPKLWASVTTPLSAVAYQLIVTGTLDRPSLGLLAVALVGGIGVFLAPPGHVVKDGRPTSVASDHVPT